MGHRWRLVVYRHFKTTAVSVWSSLSVITLSRKMGILLTNGIEHLVPDMSTTIVPADLAKSTLKFFLILFAGLLQVIDLDPLQEFRLGLLVCVRL